MSQTNFEQMSNEELRQKMEEFGLPKVPITASTRSILIKRLQNHLTGGAATGKGTPASKARRETMHVVKYSSDDDSDRDVAKEKLKKKLENHKNARRQTIGGAALNPAPAPAPAPVAVEKSSRKSMRATPTKTLRESGIQPPSKHIIKTIPVTIEDSDEGEEVVVPAPPPKRPMDRRSKSKTPVTLAKSDLVTTSYKQVVAPVQEEEPIELEDDEEQSDLEENVPLAPRFSPRKYEVTEPKATNYSQVKPMSIRISPLRRTTGNYGYESGLSKADAVSSTSYTRPSLATTSSYNTSYTSKYATGGSSAATNGNGDEDEFPYLREFSKRLSTLKAEPLYKRNVPLSTSSTSNRTSTTSYSSSRATGNYRSSVSQRETHWYDPITRFMAGLEEKYALKKKILILLAILIVIFVVVMVWY